MITQFSPFIAGIWGFDSTKTLQKLLYGIAYRTESYLLWSFCDPKKTNQHLWGANPRNTYFNQQEKRL
jgi:hypothetical protein